MSKYGRAHRELRDRLLPFAWGRPCHFCKTPMRPDQALDLDHTSDGQSYRGIAHASCNRRDGARQKQRKSRRRRHSRDW